MTINNEEKYLENEVNANNTGNTSNQLCQRCEPHRQKLWQSVYRKSDVLGLLGVFGRKRRSSEGLIEVKSKK
ncbi:hypothetical protein HMPREF9072_01497 [Capnocytophaga sp. oral taxon 324 str. F0483]|nr:hypothetical protein HMPREF9072_01497 [Capnocytophaga sp. oral taxon 324 str. F0483]